MTEQFVGKRSLATRLADREQFAAAWFALGSPEVVETALAGGCDLVVLDLQHGLWDRRSVHWGVAATGAVPVLLRTADNTVLAIGEALDSGADGVLVPLIESAEQAAAAVAAARFPPHGTRSGGGIRPLAHGFVRYHADAEDILIGVMIETALGVSNAAAIAATPGVDLVLIGTGDLALSLGTFPDAGWRYEEACATILAACGTAGVPCAIFTNGPVAAAKALASGYAMAVVALDIDLLAGGLRMARSLLATECAGHVPRTDARPPLPAGDADGYGLRPSAEDSK